MAAHKATVSVSASVLPDDMKASVGGTIVYDLNDIGNNNKWVYFANNVSTTAQSIMADGVSYLAGNAGDETAVVDADADDLGFLVLKHSGYQGDGTTTSTDNLYLNIADSGDAGPTAGSLVLEPGDVWWGRFVHSDVDDISVEAAGNTVKLLIYAVLDDGGV
tara:strand:+ start:2858 stop:3343 length:486 start_codon:yes stop_codon:yes gene_type:complete